VTFDNNKFSLGHICEFVSTSPKDGWQVSFCGKDYSNASFLCEIKEIWNTLFGYFMMKTEHYIEVVYDDANITFLSLQLAHNGDINRNRSTHITSSRESWKGRLVVVNPFCATPGQRENLIVSIMIGIT
jgi:hypothetical protein